MVSSDASPTLVTPPPLEALAWDDDEVPTRTEAEVFKPADGELELAELDFDEDIETRVVRRAPSEDELSRARSSAPPPPTSEPRTLPPMQQPPLPTAMQAPPASGEREVTIVDGPRAMTEERTTAPLLPPPAAPPRKALPPAPSSQPDTERRPPAALDSEPSTARRPQPVPVPEPSTKRRLEPARVGEGQRTSQLPLPVPPPRQSRPTMPSGLPRLFPPPPPRPLIAITPSAALAPARPDLRPFGPGVGAPSAAIAPRAVPPPPRTVPMLASGAPPRLPPAAPPPARERFDPKGTTRMQLTAPAAELPRAAPLSSGQGSALLPSRSPTPPQLPGPPPSVRVAATPFAPALPVPMVLPAPAPLPSSIPPPVVQSTDMPSEPSGWTKAAALLGALSLVITLGLGAFMLWPRTGALRVEVSGDAGSVGRLAIYVDGQKRCDTAPCVVPDLEPGARSVQIAVADGPPLSVSEQVVAGRQTTVVVPLQNPSGATIKVTGGQAGVKVYVDGEDHGPLPVQLKAVAPGSHRITFDGGDRYEKAERTVEVASGQVLDLGQVMLPVRRGLVTIHLETQGASVMVVSANRKSQKALQGPWPMTLDVEASEGWRLVATKPGHQEVVEELSFADGNAERRIDVELAPLGVAASSAPVAPAGGKSQRGGAPLAPAPAPAAAPMNEPSTQAAAPSGPGTLNANSLPVSKVIVDGRALGSTPQTGISLPAGPHTVTFVHPELGKKTVTVQVRPGEKAVAAVRFGSKEEAK